MVWLKYRDIKGKSLPWYREFFICNCSISICQFRFFIPSRNALRAHPILRGFSYAPFFNISQKWLSKFLMENRSFFVQLHTNFLFWPNLYLSLPLLFADTTEQKQPKILKGKINFLPNLFLNSTGPVKKFSQENSVEEEEGMLKELLCEAAALTNFGIYFLLHKKCNLRHSCPKCVYTHL